ncbi:unnamed protein product [Pichia kudriavzevii]
MSHDPHNRINGHVSLVEYNHHGGVTHYASNYTMRYYLKELREKPSYKVVHLSSILFDVERLKTLREEMTVDDSLMSNIQVAQTLSLSQILITLKQLKYIPQCIILEDLDEAFNVSMFEDQRKSGRIMIEIIKHIRDISQNHLTTVIITQRKPRQSIGLHRVSSLLRNMMDNQILIDGDNVQIDSIYDDIDVFLNAK